MKSNSLRPVRPAAPSPCLIACVATLTAVVLFPALALGQGVAEAPTTVTNKATADPGIEATVLRGPVPGSKAGEREIDGERGAVQRDQTGACGGSAKGLTGGDFGVMGARGSYDYGSMQCSGMPSNCVAYLDA